MSCHLTPVRMAITNKPTDQSWRGRGAEGTLAHCWWECRSVRPLWETVWTFLGKLNVERLHDSEIALLGLYPQQPETLA